ncbi:MAG: 50S ribosomal protein L5 [Thermoproteota archaeon]|jgi:large subunit ribosomal protein L5
MSENPMKKIRLEKVVLNMGVGKSGEAIEIAKKALDQITGKKSCARDAKATQRDWGVRKGEPIGVAVTVRGQDAATLLKRLFDAVGNRVKGKSFDDFGNISFGIKEHIDIPGIKYDPQIGILGLEAAVTLTRPGFSIRVRSRHKARIGKHHRISKDEAIEFLTREFGVAIV